MGLDTSHDAWHGPYSSFHRWRKWVAGLVGIDLDMMEGFRGDKTVSGLTYDFPPRPWSDLGDDPIIGLLSHSDCDGFIPWDETDAIADRLDGLISNCVYDRRADYDGQLQATQRFIRGLRAASEAREDLDFH